MQKKNVQTSDFYRSLLKLVVPIAMQNLISTAVNSADVIMVGYVGQDALSAVSLANQLQFILSLVYSGIASGTTMLAAQYWGKRDTEAIEKIMGIALRFSAGVSALFALLACGFPGLVMRIFTNDTGLIATGSSYLRIVGISYLFMSVSQVYLCTMRSIERVVFSMTVFGSALIINICLNAVFIFGLFGMPRMGAAGAALATVIARGIETGICLLDSLRFPTVRLRIGNVFGHQPVLFGDFLRYALPAFGNDVVWGVAFSLYSVIMGHLGSDIVAANSVVVVARNLGTVVCTGIASGGAIYLGKQIGDGQMEEAKRSASRLCKVTFATGVLGGILVLILKPAMAMMVELTPTAASYLSIMLYINAYYVLGQAMNTTVISGIFRAGGDSRFGFICDTVDMWGFAVPAGFLAAFVLKLPPMWVYFIICLDEFVKMPFVYKHYKSFRWLKNITREEI